MACTRVVLPDPSSPDSPITTGAARLRPSSSPNRFSSSARSRIVHHIPFGLELEELIAQHCCELEVELLCGGLHLLFEQPDERLPLARVRRAAERREIGRASCRERV